MSRLPINVKERALDLRRKGYSIKEISDKLDIAKSTSSLWVRSIKLNKRAQLRLKKRKLLGYYKAALWWQRKQDKEVELYKIKSLELLKKINKDSNHAKIYCALLFWCEGEKGNRSGLRFINSDPNLMRTFINLLRKSFPVCEEKFRILMHLHEYHDNDRQKEYWSKVTGVPTSQFCKTYLKPHTKKRLRDNYPGCVCLSYYDVKIARELRAIYNTFSKNF